MLILSLAFSVLISGYDAYINACSSQGEPHLTCKCQADFLSLNLSDEKILEIAIAGSNAAQGRTDKMKELATKHPDAVIALEKLERQSLACGREF